MCQVLILAMLVGLGTGSAGLIEAPGSKASASLALHPAAPPPAPTPSQDTVAWQKTWGLAGLDEGLGVAVDGLNNIYVTGISGSDVLLLKYDPSGNLLWQRTWGGGGGTEFGAGIALDSSGNIYVAGGTDSLTGSGNVFLLKFNPAGGLVWQKTWGGGSADYGTGIAVDASGNIYVTGTTVSIGAGLADLILLKFSSVGNLLWQRVWGGTAGDFGTGVALDPLGNIYVTGRTGSSGAGGTDALLLKFDPGGTLLWQKVWGGSNGDEGDGVAVDSSGNIYITGRTLSLTSATYMTFLLKFYPGGSLTWQKVWDGSSEGLGVTTDRGGNVYVTGSVGRLSSSANDAFILEFDPLGGLVWQKVWGGSASDIGTGIALDFSGNVLVAGIVNGGPPYILRTPVAFVRTTTLTPADATGTLQTPTYALTTPGGTLVTPSGSESYAGGYDLFVLKYHPTPPGAIEVLATVLTISSPEDLDGIFAGAGECYLLSDVNGLARRWPSSGSVECGDGAFTLHPNFNVYGPQWPNSGLGGVRFHIEGWEQDDFLTDGDDTFGSVDFSYSQGELLPLGESTTPCISRTDTTSGGEAPMQITTQICVYPQPAAPSGCAAVDGTPPRIRTSYSPLAPDGDTFFNVTVTATDFSGCGLSFIRIQALGPSLTVPQAATCTVEIPQSSLTCARRFGRVLGYDGSTPRYVVLQVRAGDAHGQITYEPPILFETGRPRSNSYWSAPTLVWGTKVRLEDNRFLGVDDRKDLVYFPDPDYVSSYGASGRARFLADLGNMIYRPAAAGLPSGGFQNTAALAAMGASPFPLGTAGGYTYYVQESNIYHLNFWYMWSSNLGEFAETGGDTQGGSPSCTPTPCAIQPRIPGCGIFDPCNWGFADSKAVVHVTPLRDASWAYPTSCYCYTVQNDGGMTGTVVHESGHNLYGLADEYGAPYYDGGYSADGPFRNVFIALSPTPGMNECQYEASISTPVHWDPSTCRIFVPSCTVLRTLSIYWGPCWRSDADPDIMATASPGDQFGNSDVNRIMYVHGSLPLPVPNPSFVPISGTLSAASLTQGADPTDALSGVCVHDKDGSVCFPNATAPSPKPSKILVVVLSKGGDGSLTVLGSSVTYGTAPDPDPPLQQHYTIRTETIYGEELDRYGLRSVVADGYAPQPLETTFPLILSFRAQMKNVTVRSDNGSLLLNLDVSAVLNNFCSSHSTDEDCRIQLQSGGADAIQPSWPAGAKLEPSSVGTTTLTLKWTAAADNIGVEGYRVYRDGTILQTVAGSVLILNVTGLTPGTKYYFAVDALDAAGNLGSGPSVTVTTALAPVIKGSSFPVDVSKFAWAGAGFVGGAIVIGLILRRRRKG